MSDAKSKQIKETATAYAAFLAYCRLGIGRSLKRLAQVLLDEKASQNITKASPKLENILRQAKEWSRQHNWQERVKDYDRERFRQYEQTSIDKLLEYIDADVEEITPAAQIKAIQLLLEYSMKNGKLAELEEQLMLTKAALERAGIVIEVPKLAY